MRSSYHATRNVTEGRAIPKVDDLGERLESVGCMVLHKQPARVFGGVVVQRSPVSKPPEEFVYATG